MLSSDEQLIDASGAGADLMHRRSGEVANVLAEMRGEGYGRVWLCGGGNVAGQALAEDAVDEVIVTIAPTVLGSGPALFDHPQLQLRRFRLEECRRHGDNGVRITWTRDRSSG